MIRIARYEDLGHHDYGWLNAHYHFSFGEFYDPNRMGFGKIRVINDDIIKAGAGFPPHPHKDMEIITYVRSGAITHEDSLGNKGRTEAGDIQVMSAGTGIRHGEFNREKEATTLYQIWIEPRDKNIAPRWDARAFPKTPVNDALPLLASGRPQDAGADTMLLHADAALYGGQLPPGHAIRQTLSGPAYALVSEGAITLNGQELKKGDGAAITDEDALDIAAAGGGAEILLIALP